ncbi:beta strand repeat-containing protein [Leptothoe sp. PORK10 BA2]|uniref:beta strand repeat-containing protein n=1 Tax=Leptothoe sp. PORK10 BA2 TaxID=3110254 RepID=UPI002B202B62|nr:filamentous hemagglutinin N-terminal domain-containing protein [Leptothoe sp. PORK10 BA2]MEA5464075.1 filamentous hemagglutinin N-terminal domain-containing protein [Leptothoe sp. PORK10 BA2]
MLFSRPWYLAGLLGPWLSLLATPLALAQVTPDATLGAEGSLVSPGVDVRGEVADLLEGGAIRGGNLFHSFLEFNIGDGQRVYFANPVGIESILSRVTGGNPSAIFGTLGVDGAADLFLLNPNGIIFGENAALDIEGSFYASTAEAISLGSGVYSATTPERSSLLTVNPSALVSSYLSDASGDIENRSQLAAGENLTLAANNLDLQGQVAAAGDLMLLGNAVQIRDTATVPFVGFAGGDLLVQGNEAVDIVALSHPDSGLYSYGDMVLRSTNPVGGDAHYWSGGSFRVENLDENLGELFSPIDPIIRALGDVEVLGYQGSSLHILAGGSVNIGTAIINAPDPGTLGVDFLQETIQLSDGTIVQIDGGAQPTLDVRAGVAPEAIGVVLPGYISGLDLTSFIVGTAFDIPTSSDITVSDVLIAAPNGLVLLTTHYQPNADLAGGNIFVTGTGLSGAGIDVRGFGGQGGAVYLDARNDVSVVDSSIQTSGAGVVGDVVINAGSTVRFDGQNRLTGVASDLAAGTEGTGGSIQITATNIEVLNGARLSASTLGDGDAGNVVITASDAVVFDGTSADGQFSSAALSSVEAGATGAGGNVEIAANSLAVRNGARLTASTLGDGDAGNVVITASDAVVFDGTSADGQFRSAALSRVEAGATGAGGNVEIAANSLAVSNGAGLSASTLGDGDAGNVVITASDAVVFDGTTADGQFRSAAFSTVEAGATGAGGNVEIAANSLAVRNGAGLTASTLGDGDAGNVVITASDAVVFDGTTADGQFISAALSTVAAGATGAGGNVEIAANSLAVRNGAGLSASTFGDGDAGNVVITASDAVVFDGTSADGQFISAALSRVAAGATGAGGNVEIAANSLAVRNGAQLTASTLGDGDAGNVVITASDAVVFDGTSADGQFSSAALSRVAAGATGAGGNVEIAANSLAVLNGAVLSASTFGDGDAGNVVITASDAVVFDGTSADGQFNSGAGSSVEAGATGAGGNVEIAANSLAVRNGAQLVASTFGDGDAGNVVITASDAVVFDGISADGQFNSGAGSSVEAGATGAGGNVEIAANSLAVRNGAGLSASTFGDGDAGNVVITASDAVVFDGTSADGQFNSGAFSSVEAGATGAGGNVEIAANSLAVLNGAQLVASTFGDGDAGNVVITASDAVVFDGTSADGQFSSAAGSSVEAGATGAGGNVEIAANSLAVRNGAVLSTSTFGDGDAGNVVINVDGQIRVNDGEIRSLALATSGGRIDIRAGNLILRENSNILTVVDLGEGSGGNITIIADFVIALDDSDILAFSADGRGGAIDLSGTTFFGQNANIGSGNLTREELLALDGNNRVDINATGGVESGQISTGDSSFIENSLTSLSDTITDTAALTAGSCIARTSDSLGSFVATGSGGLPQRPDDIIISTYPTGTVRTVAEPTSTPTIQEPDSVYQLPDGRLVLSRACE